MKRVERRPGAPPVAVKMHNPPDEEDGKERRSSDRHRPRSGRNSWASLRRMAPPSKGMARRQRRARTPLSPSSFRVPAMWRDGAGSFAACGRDAGLKTGAPRSWHLGIFMPGGVRKRTRAWAFAVKMQPEGRERLGTPTSGRHAARRAATTYRPRDQMALAARVAPTSRAASTRSHAARRAATTYRPRAEWRWQTASRQPRGQQVRVRPPPAGGADRRSAFQAVSAIGSRGTPPPSSIFMPGGVCRRTGAFLPVWAGTRGAPRRARRDAAHPGWRTRLGTPTSGRHAARRAATTYRPRAEWRWQTASRQPRGQQVRVRPPPAGGADRRSAFQAVSAIRSRGTPPPSNVFTPDGVCGRTRS